MMAWTIEAAIKSGLFDRIIVSTDSEKYATIAQEYGASCDFLREKYNDDLTPVSMATLHSVEISSTYYGEQYDTVTQLMANCPIRTGQTIKDLYANFLAYGQLSVISCFDYGWINPWWAHEIDEKGKAKAIFDGYTTTRSQDLPKLYCPTGAVWISTSKNMMTHKTFYSPNYRFVPIPWKEAIDIDDKDDLEQAETLFRK